MTIKHLVLYQMNIFSHCSYRCHGLWEVSLLVLTIHLPSWHPFLQIHTEKPKFIYAFSMCSWTTAQIHLQKFTEKPTNFFRSNNSQLAQRYVGRKEKKDSMEKINLISVFVRRRYGPESLGFKIKLVFHMIFRSSRCSIKLITVS